MPALTRSIGGATVPALPIQTVRRRLLRALWRTLDHLVPPNPGRDIEPPPEFFRFPPF
jgi:hypothetical protein